MQPFAAELFLGVGPVYPRPMSLDLAQLGLKLTVTLFLFAVGACVGSLTNVLVYRLPLGLGVVTQGSRCPACGTPLTWRENIPIFGWLFLGGRCRFCKSTISPEYPAVELLVALLFAAVYVLWYWIPSATLGLNVHADWLGINWAKAAPEWALSDRFDAFPRTTWAPLIVELVLLGSLVAMTLVDAKTFTIPLQIPWFATVVGIAVHTIGAAIEGTLRTAAPGTGWSIPIPGGSFANEAGGWFQIGMSLGGVAGLGLAMLLLKFELIRRSFDDYQAWEDSLRQERDQARRAQDPSGSALHEADVDNGTGPFVGIAGASIDPTHQAAGPVGEHAADGAWRLLRRVLLTLGIGVIATALGAVLGPMLGFKPWSGLVVGAVLAPILAAALPVGRGKPGKVDSQAPETAQTAADQESAPEMWIQYPHARREMLKELLFLTPCVGLAWVGGIFAARFAPAVPPFWLVVLSGTLLGYLVGGGIVWLVRIAGSLAFGKEAMGLGDVHLMAAVGACSGWMDAALAFPLAAFVGLYWVVVARVAAGRGGEVARAMPFGPYLAIATAGVILGKPLVELGLNALVPGGPGVPPINLP